MTYLVTGTAGFIGFHTALRLLDRGETVVGLDSVNDYYSVALKQARLARLTPYDKFEFVRGNIADAPTVQQIFKNHDIGTVIHLAAQAGVRYSIENPQAYITSNLVGFQNMIDAAKAAQVDHFVYASSSSVYGGNAALPFSVSDNVDHPLSLYAATKKSNELVAHCYASLYDLPTTGLRFFTVYGPWGRPDMALFIFTRKILAGETIEVFNHGRHARDFTYIDDIVEGVTRVADTPAGPDPDWNAEKPDAGSSVAPYRVYNIGNNQPVLLMDYINEIEQALGKKAKIKFLPLQPGDVPETYADITALERAVGFRPQTPIKIGIARFVEWYKTYSESQ